MQRPHVRHAQIRVFHKTKIYDLSCKYKTIVSIIYIHKHKHVHKPITVGISLKIFTKHMVRSISTSFLPDYRQNTYISYKGKKLLYNSHFEQSY